MPEQEMQPSRSRPVRPRCRQPRPVLGPPSRGLGVLTIEIEHREPRGWAGGNTDDGTRMHAPQLADPLRIGRSVLKPAGADGRLVRRARKRRRALSRECQRLGERARGGRCGFPQPSREFGRRRAGGYAALQTGFLGGWRPE
jgi:hypothetical protein